MPIYVYEHTEDACSKGKRFEELQSMSDDPFKLCPECKGTVIRIITNVGLAFKKGNAELKNMGFKKLVRRDKGVYEDVTGDGGPTIVDVN